MNSPRDLVHFVGSVPLHDCGEVFRTLAAELGPFVRRLPDGETGERSRWIYFQREMLEAHPAMEIDPTAPPLRLLDWTGDLLRETRVLRIRPEIDQGTVDFPTGYDEAALQSWEVFRRMRKDGAISPGTRFQVSLPTPHSSAYMYISAPGRPAYVAAYERSLLAALDRILAAIPAEDLCIQWDICQEILVFEDYFPNRPPDYKTVLFALIGRLGDAVPADVELGLHLCYGSPADKHLVQPTDAAILVEMMEGIAAAVRRLIDFFHIPMPREVEPQAFLAPLRNWRRAKVGQLYIGLIHHDDEDGNRRRLAAARVIVPNLGVASECGWGRSDPGRLPGLLDSHRHAAEELAS